MNLYDYFLRQTGRRIIKNVHYFPIYERHFARYVGRSVLMYEIGTGDGGSAEMWKHYFGPLAHIVTIDIRDCSEIAQSQISVRTGSQSDPGFLKSIVAEFGPPDIVLDDGSHIMSDINASFDVLFPALRRDGIYLVEDLNTAYWPHTGGGLKDPRSFIERAKNLVDEMNAGTSGAMEPTVFGQKTFSISFYDLVVVIERAAFVNKEMLHLPA